MTRETSNKAAAAGKASEKKSLVRCDAGACQDAWAAAVLFVLVVGFAFSPLVSTLCRVWGVWK